MTQSFNPSEQFIDGKRELRFVVAATRYSGLHHVDDYSTHRRAILGIKEHSDKDPLHVALAEIWYAPNGNIRMWDQKSVRVHVELVNPTEILVGGEDVTEASATLNLVTGDIILDDPKFGHPLFHWRREGVCIIFSGVAYSAALRTENLPEDIWGDEIVDLIRENGYMARIELESLQYFGCREVTS